RRAARSARRNPRNRTRISRSASGVGSPHGAGRRPYASHHSIRKRRGMETRKEGAMTKAQLIDEVARVADLSRKHAETIIDIFFQSIVNALERGEKIELRGFGSFRIRQRNARQGRNPKTGETVSVPAKRIPYFKPGRELKELLNS